MEDTLKQKLENYKVPVHAKDMIRDTHVVFLVGTSGAGKDTVIRELLKTGKYHYIVSHTTRQPRTNHGVLEKDGLDYHFIDLAAAEAMLDEGGFVEAKMFSGNIYGTSVAEIQMAHDEGRVAVSEIEVQGIAEYKAVADSVIPIFLLPPDYKTWRARLAKRYEAGHVDIEEMKKRLETAKVELREALEKDYFEFVINKDLETTVQVVDQIAHGHVSTKKNNQARKVAQNLLNELVNDTQ